MDETDDGAPCSSEFRTAEEMNQLQIMQQFNEDSWQMVRSIVGRIL